MPANLLEPQPAPLAGRRRVLVSPVQLYKLDGVAEAELEDAGALGSITMHLHDRHLVYKLLGIGAMSLR